MKYNETQKLLKLPPFYEKYFDDYYDRIEPVWGLNFDLIK